MSTWRPAYGMLMLASFAAGCSAAPATTDGAERRSPPPSRTAPTAGGDRSAATEDGALQALQRRQAGGDDTMVASGRRMPGAGRQCREGVLPDFPWPIPEPSARMALPAAVLSGARATDSARLRDAANELDSLLLQAGYSERAYFRMQVEGETVGFSIVTRMERITKDGAPYPPRKRFLPVGSDDQFSMVEFLKGLFVAPVGYYRVLVFTVSRTPLRADAPPIDEAGAEAWLHKGGTRLLGCVAEMRLDDDFGVDALIYEFRHAPEEVVSDRGVARDKPVSQLIPSKLDPAIHLRRAGILASNRTRP